jgi:hypothetical protein
MVSTIDFSERNQPNDLKETALQLVVQLLAMSLLM